jgi:hypothetical protein
VIPRPQEEYLLAKQKIIFFAHSEKKPSLNRSVLTVSVILYWKKLPFSGSGKNTQSHGQSGKSGSEWRDENRSFFVETVAVAHLAT